MAKRREGRSKEDEEKRKNKIGRRRDWKHGTRFLPLGRNSE